MNFLTVSQIAEKWKMSERNVRNYCATGKISEAFLTEKTWNIPDDDKKPESKNKKNKAGVFYH